MPFVVQDLMYDLIQRSADGSLGKPFFAMLPMLLPHPEYEAPSYYSDQFADEFGNGTEMSMWLSELAVLDDLVGNMFKYCKDAGILDNTYIIFAGDHSGENFKPEDVNISRSYPFFGTKGQIWDGGIRTPAFIYNPKMDSLEISSLTSVTDWLPTIAELAGISSCDLPMLDGISLVSLLDDGDATNEDRMLLINVDPDCGGCYSRRRFDELLNSGLFENRGPWTRRRRLGADRGPSAAIRYRDYKLLVSCVAWDGDIDDQDV